MTVETSTYISELNPSYPAAGDLKSEGDDHMRKIKSTLKATFPNFSAAACTPTTIEVNYLTGVTSAIQTQLNAKAPLASPTFTGTVTVPTPTNPTDATNKSYVDGVAFSGVLPAQSSNSGKVITTNGSVASWTDTLTNLIFNGYTEGVVTANTTTAYTIALTGTVQILTLTGNCTYTFPTAVAGKSFLLVQKQDATGSRTVTWPGTVKWPASTAPTLTATASKADLFGFTCDGTNWFGRAMGANFL